MPIYAYKCSSCGHSADVMQKLSDAPLSVCTACAQPTFSKQITAAGFQLKGSGWYATDFKNGSKGPKKDATDATAGEKTAEKAGENKAGEGKTETAAEKKTEAKTETKTETKPASPDTKSTA